MRETMLADGVFWPLEGSQQELLKVCDVGAFRAAVRGLYTKEEATALIETISMTTRRSARLRHPHRLAAGAGVSRGRILARSYLDGAALVHI
jgi:hypothetical protein